MNYDEIINGYVQGDTIQQGSLVNPVADNGNMVSVMRSSDLSPREQELITALRRYGNEAMIESILARIEEIRRMSKY